jgi:hypothetical protein
MVRACENYSSATSLSRRLENVVRSFNIALLYFIPRIARQDGCRQMDNRFAPLESSLQCHQIRNVESNLSAGTIYSDYFVFRHETRTQPPPDDTAGTCHCDAMQRDYLKLRQLEHSLLMTRNEHKAIGAAIGLLLQADLAAIVESQHLN